MKLLRRIDLLRRQHGTRAASGETSFRLRVEIMPNFGVPHREASREQDQRSPLNWRRGLFRIWLLLSAGWILGWVIYFAIQGMQEGLSTSGEWISVLITLLAPPIAMAIFGAAMIWALRGFVE
jgi:hypothetical protein